MAAMISWDRYEIKQELYESFSFLLYRGMDRGENRPVLIKMLKPGHLTLPNIARWSWDLEVSRNLQRDFVLNPLKLEKNSSTIALVFEDFGGDLLLSKMPFKDPWEKFFQFSLTLVDLLEQLHCQGVHRNLAPHNILVDSKWEEVKMTSFGFFQYWGAQVSKFTAADLSEENLNYRAPEFVYSDSSTGTGAMDLYSLGAILFQLATGFPPFRPAGPLHLPSNRTEGPPNPQSLNPTLPGGMSRIISTLLSPSSGDRYPERGALAKDLKEVYEEWKDQSKIYPAPVEIPEETRASLFPLIRDSAKSSSLSFLDFSYLDWMAFQKSCQLFFEKAPHLVLLQRWLRILLEVSGAQKGFWTFQKGDQNIEISLPQEESSPLYPSSLLKYVQQKKEPLIFSSEKEYSPFVEDPYFVNDRPKSLLIYPFYLSSDFIGFLYLENSLMERVFNFSRMEIIKILCMQAYSFAEKITLEEELERAKTSFLCPYPLCGELLEHFSEGIVCLDQSFQILWFNAKAAQIFEGLEDFERGNCLTHLNNRPLEDLLVRNPEGSDWHQLHRGEEGNPLVDVALVSYRNGIPGTRCFLILRERVSLERKFYI